MHYEQLIALAFREEVSQTLEIVYQTGRTAKGSNIKSCGKTE